ncbi:hypothetical protein E2C01_084593 [Portunus trituberculatus]|uniref:Uncharacterized protein n=1 Tax=Portunus trituberculatus TaxID=210409 RepID=A0A5B7J4M4_PORTR|nr:hypothetical protein [Portunus trituberculatus]
MVLLAYLASPRMSVYLNEAHFLTGYRDSSGIKSPPRANTTTTTTTTTSRSSVVHLERSPLSS